LELGVGDCLPIITVFISVIDTVETFRVLDYNIEPDVGLYLAEHVRMRAGCNTLDWRLLLGEGLEKVDDSFRDANLFSLLMDVHCRRVEEVNFAICVLFLLGLARPCRQ
jgi:hypothetical protein